MPGEAFIDTPLVNGTAYPDADRGAEGVSLPHPERRQRPLLEPAAVRGRPGVDERRTAAPTPRSRWFPPLPRPPGFPGHLADRRPRRAACPTRPRSGPDWIQIGTEGGFLPDAGGDPEPAGHLEHGPDDVQLRQRRQDHSLLLGTGRARRRHRRLLRVRRQDPHPLQRRPGRLPGARPALRLLHGRPGPDRHRRPLPARRPASAPTPAPSCRSRSRTLHAGAGLRPGGA